MKVGSGSIASSLNSCQLIKASRIDFHLLVLTKCQTQDVIELREMASLNHPVCFVQDEELQVLDSACQFVVLNKYR